MIDAKNAVLIALVLFVAAIVGLYIPYVQYQSSTPLPERSHAPKTGSGLVADIVYDNRGFEPDSITIAIGTTVHWTNASDGLMWVASDPHPAHTDLPGFDARGVGAMNTPERSFTPTAYAHTTGAHYEHTFTETGHWKYHNHLNPAHYGLVVVE